MHKASWRNEIVAVKIIEIDQNHEEIQKEVNQPPILNTASNDK